MHETAITNSIIEEANKHGNVKELHLEIGELAHVPSDDLVKCLKSITPWKIVHTENEARSRCECGFEGHPKIVDRGHDYFYIECPRCQNVPELIKGTEIKILKGVIE